VTETEGASPLNPDPAPHAQLASTLESEAREPSLDPKALGELILARLDDDKAQEVVFIDLKDKSSVADAMIVASGRSQRHVGAMADHLLRSLKDAGLGKAKVEGLPHCDWVLIDAGDLIVHLFRPEVRAFYNIEKIWSVDSPSKHAAV
jgi:ribosome-associated protein